MSADLKNYYENHPLWWAFFFFMTGFSICVAAGNFFYVIPRDQEIAGLQKQLETLRSNSPAKIQQLESELQNSKANREQWVSYAKSLESKSVSCDNNTIIMSDIHRLNLEKRTYDESVNSLLLSVSGNDVSKASLLRVDEYRRQATQIQEQILGLQAKITQ